VWESNQGPRVYGLILYLLSYYFTNCGNCDRLTEHSCLEKDLGCTKTVLIGVKIESSQYLLSYYLTISETLRYSIWGQNRVPANIRENVGMSSSRIG